MKKPMYILAVLLAFLLMAVSAHATIGCNITNPSSGSVINVGTQLNITYNASVAGSTANVTVALFAKSSQSLNTTFTRVFNQSNISNLLHVNITFPSNATVQLGDAADYSFFATCYENATAAGASADQVTNSSIITNVQVDRSSPTAPSAITFTNPVSADQTITTTISRSNTNRCFIRFGGASNTPMTLSGSTCTFTVQSDSPPNSDYQAFLVTDDNSNSTLSTIQYITVRASTSDGGGGFNGGIITVPSNSNSQSVLGGTSSNPFAPKKKDNTGLIVITILMVLYLANKNKRR